jgi:hypothetical protein
MKLSRIAFPLLVLALAAPVTPVWAEEGWTFQTSLGVVENLETPLTIRQSGFPDIELDADYETRPFESPFYYSLRAGRWSGRGGWELELIHLKLYLQNRPPEVQQFSISHGYNLVMVNRGWDVRRLILRAGVGAVVAHPETTVRGRPLEDGYHVTGPAVQVAAEKRLNLGERWFLGLEGKVSAARANVPVAGGEAEMPSVAGHLLVGLGYRFGSR